MSSLLLTTKGVRRSLSLFLLATVCSRRVIDKDGAMQKLDDEGEREPLGAAGSILDLSPIRTLLVGAGRRDAIDTYNSNTL
ncbi:hypothetical protein [Burkholderia cepacia]|uniref:hypothetical protein n=1 Tax=Burkholderia cepacia TaxID=292 RepID=UPI0010FD931A|nr:hypothetical protein [Burkholderia cepacia]MCA8469350.1 hypothetical protein [Burkholderia cepacia]MDN7765672.1 hypothetical protein [Burkholderia cepacia]QCY07596.1 hypothetical protein EJ998_32180 [Burkholderia cepacia ATCC 25416]